MTPDILINNAGLAHFDQVENLPLEKWQEMIDTNLNGTFYLTRLFVPMMKANPEVCHIINIVSIAGLRSEEHTSELQSRGHLVCRLLLEKKKKKTTKSPESTT